MTPRANIVPWKGLGQQLSDMLVKRPQKTQELTSPSSFSNVSGKKDTFLGQLLLFVANG